jgi:hypothetical protein
MDARIEKHRVVIVLELSEDEALRLTQVAQSYERNTRMSTPELLGFAAELVKVIDSQIEQT